MKVTLVVEPCGHDLAIAVAGERERDTVTILAGGDEHALYLLHGRLLEATGLQSVGMRMCEGSSSPDYIIMYSVLLVRLVDVYSDESVRELVQRIVNEFGRLDCALNCVCTAKLLDADDWEEALISLVRVYRFEAEAMSELVAGKIMSGASIVVDASFARDEQSLCDGVNDLLQSQIAALATKRGIRLNAVMCCSPETEPLVVASEGDAALLRVSPLVTLAAQSVVALFDQTSDCSTGRLLDMQVGGQK